MLCAYTRSRYQVSVYRTIRPLVSLFWLYQANSEVSVYRTIGPLVLRSVVNTISISYR